MRATLRDSIRIRREDVPEMILAAIEGSLTIPNPQKEVAEREKLWGAERMDAHLRLFSYDAAGYLVLPMGFLHALRVGCAAMSVPLELVDQRSRGEPLLFARAVALRGYQEPMCQALLFAQCGVGEAPTAAGKTAATLAAIQRFGRTAVVIVEKSSLAKQWMEAVERFLAIDVGYVGEGGMRIGPITIALRQAIYARMDELAEQDFFDRFGTVVVDEAHHAATAWSLIEILQRFTSINRWGVTATPDRDPDYFPVLQAVIGPVVWETTMADAADHLVIPSVRVLETDFTFDFHPTKSFRHPESGKMVTDRNNYGEMMAALCSDRARNLQIAQAARAEADAGHHVLIVSDRKKHLDAIGDLLVTHVPYVLTGGMASDTVLEVKQEIEAATHGTVLLSTVAEEGLSIDRLDRVIPAYPRRNPETMRQIAGRVMRPYPGKTDAMIIDPRDGNQFLLKSQFRDRAQMLYGKEGWIVRR